MHYATSERKCLRLFGVFEVANFIDRSDKNLWFGKPCHPLSWRRWGPEKLVEVQKNYPELQRGPAFAALSYARQKIISNIQSAFKHL
jgi:hypothetical protein